MQAIRTKSFITARNRNSILKLVKLQNSVAIRRFCVKYEVFLAIVKEQSFCSYCLDQNLVYQNESLSWELSIETEIQPL